MRKSRDCEPSERLSEGRHAATSSGAESASSPNFASSAPSQPYQQAPVMPMNVPVNVSQLQTAMMPSIQPQQQHTS